ncbi:T9SS type A sorting domain-containing protein [Polaribacter glomeratus]|uniref:Secretion system C-terminal sorting domain-containing protein n=1 Tax=Polaribacter glomeratus TaxID=102 RepID=A0A2S7WIE3_9FLAO|nr:T9SS type A sorting domain-containing protein [Polaribacter glomeratus]PQJ77364.1 hypothetical protein BTO16_16165 [Polaribacter glomeratus]TXD65951.1 T9SS type A sorting domain-containing protein [Polaribacter glomeratus]
MKIFYSPVFYVAISLVFLTSCNSKPDGEVLVPKEVKQKSKNSNSEHKKGIEYIADYQKEIRKSLDAEKSTYKEGYLVAEYNKSKKSSLAKKSANALTPVFIERGPVNVPGRTRGIAVDPTNPNKWFAGTVGGGVWLTQDAGVTWQSVTDTQIPNLATSTVEISQTDSSTLYVGTGEPFGNLGAIGGSGIFKTTDGGATWQHLTNTSTFGDVGRIIINPADKDNVLVAASRGIYRTTDGGVTWTRSYNSSGRGVQDLDADPSDFNILYGSVYNLGIVKSTDGGVNWVVVFNRSDYNGNHSRFETAVSPADPNTVLLSVYTGSSNATVGVNTDFYVSRDKGATFTNLNTNGTAASANLLTGQGWYDNVIMAHPYDSDIFYVGGIAVFKVTISGSNFTSRSIASGYSRNQINDEVHVDQHGLFTILGNNQEFKILLANDGGVYSTSTNLDPGATEGDWSGIALGKNSTQFYGVAKQNGQDNYLAGAQDNGSWRSTGNNSSKDKNYVRASGGDGFEVLWHYNKPGNFITTSQTGVIYRFINFSGSNANTPDSGDNTKSPFYSKLASADNNPDVVFTISKSGVWRSTDFAGTWNLSPITANFSTNSSSALNVKVSPADPNIVWAGSRMREDGTFALHVSQDNGQIFSKTNTFDDPRRAHNYSISGIGVSYIEGNRAYALFSAQGAAKILKTEDLGVTWTDISGFSTSTDTGFPDVAVHSILEMPFDKNIIWAGTDIGIFQTENGGTNWSLVSEFIPAAVYDMKIVNDQVVIATYGRGIWSATLSELDSYEIAPFLTLPTLSAKQKGIESLKTVVTYNVTADDVNRVKIFIDDVEQSEVIQNFSTGVAYQYETLDLPEGSHKVGVQLFDDANNNQTIIQEYVFEVIDFENASQSIGVSEFKASDVYVYNNSFKIDNVNGAVSSLVLNNSEHPYQDNKVYSTILKKPLIITEANKNFTYEDVAIVEPYTDNLSDLNSFYDYVLIEASTDLQTWKTIDKYDARRFTEWLDEYNKGTNASVNDNLFKSQTIILTDKGFSIGETVVIRFSLVSDPGANSFGWAIKSIEGAVASIDEVLNDVKVFTLYPTISSGNFTVFARNTSGKSKLILFDLNGRQVYTKNINFNAASKQTVSVNLKAGVYIVNLVDENNKQSSKKIIIK